MVRIEAKEGELRHEFQMDLWHRGFNFHDAGQVLLSRNILTKRLRDGPASILQPFFCGGFLSCVRGRSVQTVYQIAKSS